MTGPALGTPPDRPAPMTFTRSGAWLGARATLPVVPGTIGFGLVYGALARQAGLSPLEVVLSSGLVFAGSAQFVVLEQWSASLPIVSIVTTTLVINARHVLMGATLAPWFSRLSARRAYGSVALMADENWALTIRDLRQGSGNGAFLLGSGLTLIVTWLSTTVTGRAIGSAIDDPRAWGLDVAFPAIFAALLVGMWQGRASLLGWVVAAVVAVAAARWLPGVWYILLGGLAGSLAGRCAMQTSSAALVAILGMAVVTYATRASGLWLMTRMPSSPRFERWLRAVPGAILAALIAPAIVDGGGLAALAVLIAMIVVARTGSVLAATLLGVGAVVLVRFVW